MRVPVTGVGFDTVTMDDVAEWIRSCVHERDSARYICTGNLDHLVHLDRDHEFRSVYAAADLVVADGAPVIWLSKLSAAGGRPALPERVPGSDIFWEAARLSHELGLKLYFLGGATGSAERAAKAVAERFPRAVVAGIYCPPFETFGHAEEQERIRRQIVDAAPDILLVALGSPKQEKWIFYNREELNVPVSIGVGGSFEMAGGHVKRAPGWAGRMGLEWVFRFLQEPGRLWRRYFVNDVPFLLRAVVRTLRLRRSGAEWDSTKRQPAES